MASTAVSVQRGRDQTSRPGESLAGVSPGRHRLRTGAGALSNWWRDHLGFVVGSLTVAALALGYVGHRQTAGAGLSAADALYGSLQLFVMESSLAPGVPLPLNIARFLAPLVVGYIAAEVLLALFREQVELARVRMLRRHVIVVGLGDKGRRLAFALRAEDHRVVVIERNPENPSLRGCRERGIPVLRGDGSDAAVLRRAGVGRAGFLFLSAGPDADNLAIAGTARRLSARRRRTLTTIAHLDDLTLWRLLRAEAVAASEVATGMRLEFFNVVEAAARKLLSRHPPLDPEGEAGADRAEVWVYGESRLAEAFVAQLAREVLAESAHDRFDVTLAGPGARRTHERLVSTDRGLEDLLEIQAVDIEDLDELDLLARAGSRRSTYIFLERETAGMEAALRLAPHQSRDHRVVVAVEDPDVGVIDAVRSPRGALGRVEVFDVLSAALSDDVLFGGVNESLARAKHEHYVDKERERGIDGAENPSMVPWEELSDDLRDSNRSFADGVGEKLEALDLALVPAALRTIGAPELPLAEEDLEELARREHDRWVEDHERRGWTYAAGSRNPDRKTHPLLVPWSELPESEREKDREPVRELPVLLHRAGLDIRPSPGGRLTHRHASTDGHLDS